MVQCFCSWTCTNVTVSISVSFHQHPFLNYILRRDGGTSVLLASSVSTCGIYIYIPVLRVRARACVRVFQARLFTLGIRSQNSSCRVCCFRIQK